MEVGLHGVRAERDGRAVLDVPRLEIRGRRTTAILGPNGSGKTTLLRVIAGLERPVAGAIRFRPERADGPARRFRRSDLRPATAYVFQEHVFLRTSVRENLELGLRVRGFERAERRSRVDEAARCLGITHLLDRRADRLSGGEGRRVSLARALALKASLVLMDEPLEGLDERTYGRLLDELPRLLAIFDATTLLVTHSRHEALRFADDLVVLVDGRVHAVGDKREVAASPRLRSVADVLGFTVLTAGGRQLAVPPGALEPGSGDVEFSMRVEAIVDLVDRREMLGRIDDTPVTVPLTGSAIPAQPGERIAVYARRACEVSES